MLHWWQEQLAFDIVVMLTFMNSDMCSLSHSKVEAVLGVITSLAGQHGIAVPPFA